MAFSKEHRDLLLKLYNKEITRREYDRLVQSLYKPSKEVCGDRNAGDNLIDCLFKFMYVLIKLRLALLGR